MKRKIMPVNCLGFCFLLLFSCTKSDKNQRSPSFAYQLENEKALGANLLNSPAINGELVKKLKPDWSSEKVSTDGEVQIREYDIQPDKQTGFLLKDYSDKPSSNLKSQTKLIWFSDGRGTVNAALLMTICSMEGELSSDMHYKKPSANFTGLVIFTDLNYSFLNGWRYMKGEVIGRIATQTRENCASGSRAPLPSEECNAYTIDHWERICYSHPDAPSEVTCTDWEWVGSTNVVICGGAGGGGGGADYVTIYQDCEDCKEEFKEMVDNSLVISDDINYKVLSIDNDPFYKYKHIRWRVLKNITWDVYSSERGKVRLVDPATNKWEWVELTHLSLSFFGSSPGGKVEFSNDIGTPSFVPGTPNVLYAGMSVNFDVTYTPICKSCPLSELLPPVTKNYTSNGIFPAKP